MGKIDFDNLNEKLENLLVLGILGDSTQVVQELISKGADVNRQLDVNRYLSGGRHGCALGAAAQSGSTEMVRILLVAGADPNALCRSGLFGSTLAAAAASRNNVANIRLLLDAGADVNAQVVCGEYRTALISAAKHANTENIQLLLDAGADVNAQAVCGRYRTALIIAVTFGQTKSIQVLLHAGADVNAQAVRGEYGTALIAAAKHANTENIQLLLDAGADVNAQAAYGDYGTALIRAVIFAETKSIRVLLHAGADVNAQAACGDYGTALIAAPQAKFSVEEVVQLLLDAGADTNSQAAHGIFSTPLISATCRRQVGAIRRLLGAGANVNALAVCHPPRAPFILAGSDDSEDIVQSRVSMGFDPNGEISRGDLESALSVAVERYSVAVRRHYSVAMWRLYPPHVISASMDVITTLLDAGADVDLELVGEQMAEAYGLEDVVKLLLRYRKRRDEAGESTDLKQACLPVHRPSSKSRGQ